MNITTIALLPLMAYILRKRILSIQMTYKKNIVENKKTEILLLFFTISIIIILLILSEILMP